MYATKCTGAALGLVTLVLLMHSEAQGGKTKLPPAKSPEEAVKNVQAACKTGDLNLLLEQLGEPTRSRMQALMGPEVARDNILQAIHDKFGKDPQAVVPYSVKENLQHRKDIVILKKEAADKGKYNLTVWLTEERDRGKPLIKEYQWQATQEEGNWKVLFELGSPKKTTIEKKKGPDGKEVLVRVVENEPASKEMLQLVEHLKKVAPKMQTLVEQLVKDIKGGVYKNRADAEMAVQAAERRFVEENPPPGLEKKEPKK